MTDARRVLVTGGSGFIGRWAVEALHARGYEVAAPSSREADLLDPAVAARLIGEVQPTHLLHLAWDVTPGAFWTSPANVVWLEASLRLLRAFFDAGGRRAVTGGTCAEYAWGEDAVLSEATTPLRPATLYGSSKLALGQVGAGLAETAGATLGHGRIFFTFGPDEHPSRLVASVVAKLLAGERAATTSGTQVRDFLAVQDIGAAFAALVDADVHGPVNIGSGEGITIADLVRRIADATGRPDLLDIGALPDRPGEPPSLVADVERLRDAGFKPEATLDERIAETVTTRQSGERRLTDR